MNNLLILTAAILCLANQASAQVPKRYDVVGPVRSFRQETASLTVVGGEAVEGPRVLIQTATYDNRGKITEQVMNNPNGTLKWKASWNERSTHDARGREIERVSCNTSGEVTSRTVFVSNNNGSLSESVTYGAAGEITFHDTFEYDENGKKIRADYLNPDGSTRAYDVFAYDSRGYLSEVTHSGNTLQHRDSYKYDDRGNATEWSINDKSGKRGLKVSWAYGDDSRGMPTEFLRYDSSDKVLSKEVYTYEFDSHGNWIKSKTRREVFVGKAPVIETEVTYRTITYRQPQ